VNAAYETRYCRTPRGHLAYQVTGSGDRTILWISGTVSHVEQRWEIPHLVRLNRRLMSLGRVVTIDPLGMGASDPLPDPPPTLDELVDEYLHVLDEVAVDQFSIVASLHGVPAAVTAAALRPERVEKLVFLGGYAHLFRASDDDVGGFDPAILDTFLDTFMPLWGTGRASANIYGVAPDQQDLPQYARLERAAAAPGSVERLLRWITTSDARACAPLVQAPALVFGIPTQLIPIDATRALVELLPDVRYVEIEVDPVTTGEGLDEMMAEIAEFITGSRASAHADRALAAVLFTDVVGSTARAVELGDDQWRDVLAAFRLAVRRELERYEGREVNTRGDDFLIVFDRVSSAIECACALRDAVLVMGLEVRTGIHVGEVDVDADDLTGVAVHVGARVAALADPQQILVTTAAREAVAGMTWSFADRGVHDLRGVPGAWHLWAVEA
jgi:class 3 adenylate cyclase